MINIAICDDEMLVREKLSKLISAYLDKKEIEYSVMTFGTGDDLINCCESSENLSIIFLDINMKGLDGIKTGLKIREWSKEVYIVLRINGDVDSISISLFFFLEYRWFSDKCMVR